MGQKLIGQKNQRLNPLSPSEALCEGGLSRWEQKTWYIIIAVKTLNLTI